MFKEFVSAKPPLARTIALQGGFVCIPSIVDMKCVLMFTFRCHKIFAIEISPKFMRMPQSSVRNNLYKVFGGKGGSNEWKRVCRGIKDIQYVKWKAPLFDMPDYNIKSGKSRVKTGE